MPLNLPPIAAARPAPITPRPAPPPEAYVNSTPRAAISKPASRPQVASAPKTSSLVSTGERPRIATPTQWPRFADADADAPAFASRTDAASFHFGAAPDAHAQACVTPERRRGLPVWITLSAGSVALFAAGYMGAMVQLGTRGGASTTPRLIESAPAPSAPPSQPAASITPPQTAARAQPQPEAPAAAASANTPSSHARTRAKSTNSTARAPRSATAVPSSITPAPEPESAAPVITIRPLSSTEPSDTPSAPLSAAATSSTADEPSTGDRPSRDEVMRGLAGLRPQLIECAAGRHGVVDTHVTIAPNGRVTYSLISGDFVGTPEGSCMARALRSATFPSFTGPSLKVLFPYSL